MTRFLLWSAAADPQLVGDRVVERARYVGSGLALLLTAILAGVGMTLLLLPAVGTVAAAVPAAVLWALLIFNIDRLLVSNFHYGPLVAGNTGAAPPQGLRTRVTTYSARLLLAVVVAFAVTEPMMLLLFRTEVDQQLAAGHERQLKEARDRVTARLAPARADIDAALTKAETEVAAADADAKETKAAADAEENGTGGTRRPGCDPSPEGACMTKRRAAQAAQTRKEKADAALITARAQHTTDIEAWNAEVDAAVANEQEKILGNNGFLASEEALDKVMAAHPSLWFRRGVLTILFLIVDLLPVMIKLFGPPTLHDRSVRKRAAAAAIVEDDTLLAETERRQLEIDTDRETERARLDTERHEMRVWADFDRSDVDMAHTLRHTERVGRHELAVKKAALHHERELRVLEHEHRIAMRQLDFRYGETQVDEAPPESGRDSDQQKPKPPDGQLVLNGRWVVTNTHPHDSEYSSGMGETFIAHDIDDRAVKVVAKRVRQAIARNTAQRDRLAAQFEKEMTRHSAVASSHVAPVIDNGNHPEFGTFIVTKLYPDTLALRLRSTWEPSPTFTPQLEWSLRMTSQVLQGLVDCWRSGIIHLDIKPANVALDHSDIVKLIDFGLAKVAVGQQGTGTSGFPGYTLFYAAPEQIEQRQRNWWSSACDVWATGATLYEILTGRAPMQREAEKAGLITDSGGVPAVRTKEFVDLVRSQPPIPPSHLLLGLPPIVDDFVMHALEADRKRRPRDVTVAAAELRDVVAAVAGTDAEYMPVGWAHVRDGRRSGEGA